MDGMIDEHEAKPSLKLCPALSRYDIIFPIDHLRSIPVSHSLVVPALTRSFKVRMDIGECWLPLEQRLASRVEGCDL